MWISTLLPVKLASNVVSGSGQAPVSNWGQVGRTEYGSGKVVKRREKWRFAQCHQEVKDFKINIHIYCTFLESWQSGTKQIQELPGQHIWQSFHMIDRRTRILCVSIHVIQGSLLDSNVQASWHLVMCTGAQKHLASLSCAWECVQGRVRLRPTLSMSWFRILT